MGSHYKNNETSLHPAHIHHTAHENKRYTTLHVNIWTPVIYTEAMQVTAHAKKKTSFTIKRGNWYMEAGATYQHLALVFLEETTSYGSLTCAHVNGTV